MGQEFPATVSYASTGASPAAESSSTLSELPGGRYQVMGEIARGGMGMVLRAIDVDLQRPLAIKVMLCREPGGDREERFLEEARITGQLQHPGIPPVHEIGRLADGRPFLAMKLIEGRTLAELLQERPTPQTDLPRFLKIFEQIAQTMAYAHSQGVIHRDLKPLNVMVGAFGEVQVMDWGLAARLRTGDDRSVRSAHESEFADDADLGAHSAPYSAAAAPVSLETTAEIPGPLEETQPATPPEAPHSADRLTRAGQVLGTPAYMPPEQARGEIEALDERADVFGLGAILCVILTGAPPYVGRDRQEIFRRAQQTELADAFQRLAACGADTDLIAVAKDCLAPDPDARPRDAGVLAAKLTAYLESVEARLRQAELERAQAQLKAQEERKRRRLTVAWSLTAAVAITVVTGGWLWFQSKLAVQETERRQTVLAALDKVDDLTAQTRWKEAELVLDQAAQRLGDVGPADLRQRLQQARSEIRLLADLDEARMARKATPEWSQFLDHGASAAAYEQAFATFGLDVLRTEPEQTAQRLLGLRPELRKVAALALDDWVFCVTDPQLKERLRRVAGDVDDDPWRRRFRAAPYRKALETLEQETLTAELSVVSLVLLATALHEQSADEAAVRVLRRAVRLYPADFWAHFILAEVLGRRTGVRRAAVDDTEAVEERVGHLRAAVAARPQAAMAHTNLGNALGDKGDVDGAIAAFRKAIELDPERAMAHYNLGTALRAKGDVEGAIAAFGKAIELDPNAAPHTNLGAALRAKGDVEGAIAAYRKAIELDPTLAAAHNNLGNALLAKGDVEGAIAAFGKAIELDPNFAIAHNNLGLAMHDKRDVEGAIAAYHKAIELDPKLAAAHYNLGNILRAKADVEGAIAAYRKAIELDPKLAAAHTSLGNALRAKGDVEGAIAAHRKAIELDPKYAEAHSILGVALRDKGDVDGAIAAHRKAIELDPKYVMAHYNLGVALHTKGDVEGAIAAWRKAIELDPKLAPAHTNLGGALQAKGDVEGAIAACRKAIELDPKDALAHYNLGNALRAKGDVEGAIAAYRKAIELDPKFAKAHSNLGVALYDKRDVEGAIAAYRKAIELDPKFAEAHYNLGNALRAKGDVEGAIAAYRKAIELGPKLAEAHCNLGLALWSQGHFADALVALRRGHELGSQQPGWRYPSAQLVRQAERLVELDAKLSAVLQGELKPANADERLEYAQLCQIKKLCAGAARLYADAFAADPKLGDDLDAAHRYDAAISAALAGCGQGKDAAKLDKKERAAWRKQALDWLRADLKAWTALFERNPRTKDAVATTMAYWQTDPDLAGVRDEAAVKKLPAGEQPAWRQLWADVTALRKRAEQPADVKLPK